MNWRDIRVLYLRELRSALRDRTTVTNSILLPIFLYPAIMWLVYTGFTFVSGQNEEMKSRIMLKDVPAAHANLKKDFESDNSVVLNTSADPAGEIRLGTLDALVEFVPSQRNVQIENNFETRITYDESRDQSNRAKSRIDQKIARYREVFLEQQASRLGLSPQEFQNVWIDDENVSSNRQMGQFIMGLMLPMFFIIMLVVGGMHPAIDSTAGEREHSTWETVMSAATSRINVLVAKYLYVSTMAFTAAFLNLFAMVFSMGTIIAPLFQRGGATGFSFRIAPASILVILMGAVLLALFVSAGMMILASFARNYKEGQSLVSPFYIALIIPILFLSTPTEFTVRLALVPVANVAMVTREAIQGIYHWRLIGLSLVIEAVCVIAALRLAMLILKHEDFVMGNYSGNFGKFMKERLLRRKV